MEKYRLPVQVERCCAVLRQAGHEAYPVGGAVRDLLLGRVPDDWDVATSALPAQGLALFPGAKPTGLPHGTITLFPRSFPIQVTTFRREGPYSDGRRPDYVEFVSDLETDLKRRDFTVNALALARDGAAVDCFGGLDDLAARRLRCVGDPAVRFAEDALRMLRAVRFCAQLDFALGEAERGVLRRHPQWTARVSAERTRAEVERAILSPTPCPAGLFFSLGLLDRFLAVPCAPDLSGLSALPAQLPDRWGGLCRALLDCGGISGAEGFLRAMRMEKRTIRAALQWLEANPSSQRET